MVNLKERIEAALVTAGVWTIHTGSNPMSAAELSKHLADALLKDFGGSASCDQCGGKIDGVLCDECRASISEHGPRW